jgi:ASC-1-like (ASCH) protein
MLTLFVRTTSLHHTFSSKKEAIFEIMGSSWHSVKNKGNIMKYIFIVYSLLLIPLQILSKPNAFCSVPVADLLGTSMRQAQQKKLPIQNYKDIPFSDKAGDFISPRHSQLLFNEQVEILEQRGDEARVKIFHWYHQVGNKKQTTFWMQKSALTPLKNIDIKKLPLPINFETKTIPHNAVATLVEPFEQYSAGTRFVVAPTKKSKHHISVYVFDKKAHQFSIKTIPKKYLLIKLPKTAAEKRKLFVTILKQWAHQKYGYVPYVFGGASIGRFRKNSFTSKKIPFGTKQATLYQRDSFSSVCYGIDCAHTIARAAQIAGIPYFAINTKTLTETLPKLQKHESIKNGDIIVWSGHTAVISDTKKGLLIEARGYDHGYGILQEIPFSEQFQGIKTTEQLKRAYLNKTPILRLNKDGKKVQTIYNIQIITLPV